MTNQDMGRWPRRLLHVPTMTSYKWQPGNQYGGHFAPMYNALSYTWGRWRDENNLQPQVIPLRVEGIEWNIPRVLSEHFTTEEFQRIVESVGNESFTGTSSGYGRLNDDYPPPLVAPGPEEIEFLWLDVACIDQRDDSVDMAQEIGRQAQIFLGARRTFIWLNSTSHATLKESLTAVQNLASLIRKRDSLVPIESIAPQEWVSTARRALQPLFEDYWFSSLWTLQEAFLCQNSCLLSKEGKGVHFNNDPGSMYIDLNDLTIACELFANAVTRTPELRRLEEEEHLGQLVREKGLSALAMGSAIVLLACSWNRITTYPEDRIYAIMQVFDLKLGVSAPGAAANKKYTLEELQRQFGEALLENHGLLSQFHIHSENEPNAERWAPSRFSVLPEICRKFLVFRTSTFDAEILVSLSTRKLGDKMWGVFKGKMIPFETLHTSVLRLNHALLEVSAKRPKYRLLLALDRGDVVDGLPEELRTINIPSPSMQEKLAEKLAKSRPELQILLLGISNRKSTGNKIWAVGLCIIPINIAGSDKTQYWSRVGICLWPLSYLLREGKALDEVDIQEGRSNKWNDRCGLFN